MKRDARIGLAVVLVLGLSVTLLIGRALYKTTPVVEDTEHDPDASATASAEVRRVDGAETSLLTGAAAAPDGVGAPAPAPLPATGAIGEFAPPAGAATQNPAMQQFIDNQTRQFSSVERSAGAPTMQETAGLRAPAVAGNTKGPPTLEDALQDHEIPVAPNKGAEASAPSDGFGYTVASGDNMWKISTKVYGDGKYTQKIVEANKDFDTSKLKVGSVIRIPLIQNKTVLMKLPSFADAKSATKKSDSAIASNTSTKKADKTEEAPVAAAQKQVKASERTDKAAPASEPVEATTHKIESGETLGSIARKYYGFSGPKSIQRILDANKGVDAAKLKVGQEINIPAKK